MPAYEWNRIDAEPLNPLVERKVIHTENLTLARIHLKKMAIVPDHSHPSEQITMLQSGKLRFFLEGCEYVVEAGGIMVIPPGVVHRVEALEDSVANDVFAPRRDDWIRGDDAYLRR